MRCSQAALLTFMALAARESVGFTPLAINKGSAQVVSSSLNALGSNGEPGPDVWEAARRRGEKIAKLRKAEEILAQQEDPVMAAARRRGEEMEKRRLDEEAQMRADEEARFRAEAEQKARWEEQRARELAEEEA